MRIHDKVEASALLSVQEAKAGRDLELLLDKWFAKHFVKGVKLPLLRSLHSTGSVSKFMQLLALRPLSDIIAVARKLDPHMVGLLAKPADEIISHLGLLASGKATPAGKPKPARKAKIQKVEVEIRPGGVLANSRQ